MAEDSTTEAESKMTAAIMVAANDDTDPTTQTSRFSSLQLGPLVAKYPLSKLGIAFRAVHEVMAHEKSPKWSFEAG